MRFAIELSLKIGAKPYQLVKIAIKFLEL
ncbi:hypothetical protein FB2170_12581 [Maribacter sp. HTCC2170]|nr:hypothetical protein FB2170_12581 [Maribacter sp. HTCC2170]